MILINIFLKLSESAKVKILPPPPKAFRDPEMDKIKAEALIKINKNMADNKITIEKVMIDKVDVDKLKADKMRARNGKIDTGYFKIMHYPIISIFNIWSN